MAIWTLLAGSRAGRIVAGVAAIVAVLWVAFWRGAVAARRERERQDMRDYIETRERMDDAGDFGDDPALADRFLRERAAKRGRDMRGDG